MKEFLDISSFLGLPPQGAAHAAELDYWTGLVHWMMLVLAVGWGIFFIYALFRFRSRKNQSANYEGAEGKWSKYSEGGVVLAEVVLLAVFAIPNWASWRDDLPDPAREDVVEIHVIAEQFAWNLHYPGEDGVFGERDINLIDTQTNPIGLNLDDPAAADDIITLNDLHLPVNRRVLIYISSKDVIHSFTLNSMRVKQDAIPGLVIPVAFTPTLIGRSEIGCAQLCGLSHYRMRGFVTVHTAAEYKQWELEAAEEMKEFF